MVCCSSFSAIYFWQHPFFYFEEHQVLFCNPLCSDHDVNVHFLKLFTPAKILDIKKRPAATLNHGNWSCSFLGLFLNQFGQRYIEGYRDRYKRMEVTISIAALYLPHTVL